MHLAFRRSAHSFSLADIPFVFGLVFASGNGFVLGALLGSRHRLRGTAPAAPIKLGFNLAQLRLARVRRRRGRARDRARRRARAADVARPLRRHAGQRAAHDRSASPAAIAITEGGLRSRTLRQMFAMDGVVTADQLEPRHRRRGRRSPPTRAPRRCCSCRRSIVFAAYRAYVSERQRHEKLEFLYEANRTLSRSPEVAEALEGLLSRSLEAFRAELAEVLLFAPTARRCARRSGPAATAR